MATCPYTILNGHDCDKDGTGVRRQAPCASVFIINRRVRFTEMSNEQAKDEDPVCIRTVPGIKWCKKQMMVVWKVHVEIKFDFTGAGLERVFGVPTAKAKPSNMSIPLTAGSIGVVSTYSGDLSGLAVEPTGVDVTWQITSDTQSGIASIDPTLCP